MRKTLVLAAIVLLTFVMVGPTHPLSAASPLVGKRIVIDPGHGGSDWGSTECPGLPEKDADVDISRRLETLLVGSGANVLLTRIGDDDNSNNDRYSAANAFGGQALVSIHLNGSTNHTKNGTLGLYGKRNKDLEFTKTLHKRLAGELGVGDLGVTNFASGVLLKSNMPATIAEAVFISNTTECTKLTDGTGIRQQQIAQSLFNGLSDWFSR